MWEFLREHVGIVKLVLAALLLSLGMLSWIDTRTCEGWDCFGAALAFRYVGIPAMVLGGALALVALLGGLLRLIVIYTR